MTQDVLLAQGFVVRVEVAGGHRVAEVRCALEALDQAHEGTGHLADLVVAGADAAPREHAPAEAQEHGAQALHGPHDATDDDHGDDEPHGDEAHTQVKHEELQRVEAPDHAAAQLAALALLHGQQHIQVGEHLVRLLVQRSALLGQVVALQEDQWIAVALHVGQHLLDARVKQEHGIHLAEHPVGQFHFLAVPVGRQGVDAVQQRGQVLAGDLHQGGLLPRVRSALHQGPVLDQHVGVHHQVAQPHQGVDAGAVHLVDLVVDLPAPLQGAVGEQQHQGGEEDEQAEAHPDLPADGHAQPGHGGQRSSSGPSSSKSLR